MKDDGNGNAISQPSNLPYANVNRREALLKCSNIGLGYDLVTNDEWQIYGSKY